LILYDYRCACGHEFEGFAHIGDYTAKCGQCGGNASRLISAPTIKLEGWSGDFPTAAAKWTKMHEKAGKAEAPA